MLTIAFPTYKRPHRIIDAVNDTLKIDSNDIEVIVCDNNEDYKTRDILSNIKDKRFKYYKNEKNLGFCGNFKSCIMNAKGEFVLIISDEDRINHDAIPDILNIINRGGQQEISEIISGVAYIEEHDRYYVAPPKNKNQFLPANSAKKHPLYKLLRSYVSGFLFNTKIAQSIYTNHIKPFENSEVYFYYPFWIIGWLGLNYGGLYTYNSKPLIFKNNNDSNGYVEDTTKANKLFSFDSELKCLEDRINLTRNDKLLIQSSIDANNIYYIKYTTLKYDKTINWEQAFIKIKAAIKAGRKHYKLSIMHFYFINYLNKLKSIIKKIIKYKPRYKI